LRYPIAPEFYTYLQLRRNIKFIPHKNKIFENNFSDQDGIFNLELLLINTYEEIANKIANYLDDEEVKFENIRLYYLNKQETPEGPIRYDTCKNLNDMLNLNYKKNLLFYYEITQIPVKKIENMIEANFHLFNSNNKEFSCRILFLEKNKTGINLIKNSCRNSRIIKKSI
jgi:hypothetical protein